MPNFIGAVFTYLLTSAGIPSSIAGVIGLSPHASLSSSEEDGLWLQHVWPHDVNSREQLLERLYGERASPLRLQLQQRAIVDELAKLVRRHEGRLNGAAILFEMDKATPQSVVVPAMLPIREELEREHPGLFDNLLTKSHWPHMAMGLCLEPMVAEGSLMFTNSRLDIRKGDLVAYAARGLPTLGCKVYLGEASGKVFFWCNQPAVVYSFSYDQLVHVSRVSHIKARGHSLLDPRDLDFTALMSPAARMVVARTDAAPFIAPKAENIYLGLEEVFQEIIKALAGLPKERRSFFPFGGLSRD